jgi:hypothetical protein
MHLIWPLQVIDASGHPFGDYPMTDSPTTAVVPFGKYQGKPIEALREDPDYCDWLVAQDWFPQKYKGLYQIIVNNFGEASETPEHNRIQARFLDDEFCKAFLSMWRGTDWIADPRTAVLNEIGRQQRLLKELPTRTYASYDPEYSRQKETEEATEALAKARSHLADFDAHPPAKPYPIIISREFEFHGWDVRVQASLRMKQWEIYEETPMALIEIKSALGDDFPAVLRQMKANAIRRREGYSERWHAWFFLLVDQFNATGATFDQVKKMFEASNFHLLTLAMIENRISAQPSLSPA